MIIKKSTLCWLLDNQKDLVSTDRLRRFIPNVTHTDNYLVTHYDLDKNLDMSDKVHIGNWVLMKLPVN